MIVTEERWVVIGLDGRHVTLGRHSDPTPGEIEQIADMLEDRGETAWLAAMIGRYYGNRPIRLTEVRQIAGKGGSWTEAEAAFVRLRRMAETKNR